MADLSPTKIIYLVKLARPVHWIKNLGIFAAIVFSGMLFQRSAQLAVLEAFIAFNLAASATYVLNDILDAERDRKHPIKKNRPLASGKISKPLALVYFVILLVSALIIAEAVTHIFFLLLVGYLLMQTAYSLYLKHLHVIDILIIAAGFVIRVYAGAFVIDAHLSVWFLLCVISVALFLAAGKRRAELGVVGSAGGTRKTLKKYSKPLLNSYVTMFGNAAWMSWALFTFFESPQTDTDIWMLLAEFSQTASVTKLLMVTIPIAIFGIMRYEALIFEERAEAPEKLLLTDKALVGSVLLWAGTVVFILYGGIANFGSV